jgi:RNA polymerase sigma-70 factor, ECF subfamily
VNPAAADRPALPSEGEPRDDRLLLRAQLDGDQQAFATLIHRHRHRFWAVALRTLGDPEEAADALQEAFISALRGAASYRGDAAVTTWLHRIVVNACLDRIRRRQSRPTDPLEGHDPPSRHDEFHRAELRLDVQSALARLPEGQRIALVLVDMEGLSVLEAAELLGVPEGTVKSRCSRGRTALVPLLSGHEGESDGPAGNRSPAPGVAPSTTSIQAAAQVRGRRGGGDT